MNTHEQFFNNLLSFKDRYTALAQGVVETLEAARGEVEQLSGTSLRGYAHMLLPSQWPPSSSDLDTLLYRAVLHLVIKELTFDGVVPMIGEEEIHAYQHPRGRYCAGPKECSPQGFYTYLMEKHGQGRAQRRKMIEMASNLVWGLCIKRHPPKHSSRGVEFRIDLQRDELALEKGRLEMDWSGIQSLREKLAELVNWLRLVAKDDTTLQGDLLQYIESISKVIEPGRAWRFGASLHWKITLIERRASMSLYLTPHAAEALNLFVSEYSRAFNPTIDTEN